MSLNDNANPVTIVLSAVNGYGHYYLKSLLEDFRPGKIQIAGIVDPDPENSELFSRVQEMNIPVFSRIEDFYAAGNSAELAVISSPLQFHASQSIIALKNGSNVLSEKPGGITVDNKLELIYTRNLSGKFLMIGYQWCYSQAIQELKSDLMDKVFGDVVRFKTLCLWPRGEEYYLRNDWAGRIKDKKDNPVFDSPANNAMAHFLHNLLYLAGDKSGLSAAPDKITFEVYRNNNIENYDTIVCRIKTHNGIDILNYFSHAVSENYGPEFELEFESLRVKSDPVTGEICAFNQGKKIKSYGAPDTEHPFLKLFLAVQAVRETHKDISGIESTIPQTVCISSIQEAIDEVAEFPENLKKYRKKDKLNYVSGLNKILKKCYEKNILPSENGVDWAVQRNIDIPDKYKSMNERFNFSTGE